METFITIVIIVLMLVFSKPLFTIATGLLGLMIGGALLFVIFFILKALLFGT
jgi:hypothetical protein